MTDLTTRRAMLEFERSRARRQPRHRALAVAPSAPRSRKPAPRPHGSSLLSLVAMLFAGALLIGSTIPANAFLTVTDESAVPPTQEVGVQRVIVDDASVGLTIARDTFGTTSFSQLLALKYGNRTYEYATSANGTVRWPFPSPSPISDGFGERVAPCPTCSTVHNGTDFTPGAGAPVFAIAAGVVKFAAVSDSGLGNHVIITSTVGGQTVESLYAHLQMGSSPMQIGASVTVGDFVGLVGDTGTATGDHLHLEIKVDGAPVDPYAWLTANAN